MGPGETGKLRLPLAPTSRTSGVRSEGARSRAATSRPMLAPVPRQLGGVVVLSGFPEAEGQRRELPRER